MLRRLATLVVFLALPGCGSSKQTHGATGPNVDPRDFVYVQKSCAYNCPPESCSESTQPYDCQNLRDWKTGVPHADTCGSWNEKYPKVVQGKCTVSDAAGESKKFSGTDPADPKTTILPDGRRVRPAGQDWVFNETDLKGGITTGLIAIPSTSYVVTVDTGIGNHAVRLIDTTKVGSGNPVTSYVGFSPPDVLNSGMAFVPPDLLYVATDDGVVQAFTVDTSAGTLQRDDTRSLTLPTVKDNNGNDVPWYAAGVAASPDGSHLVVTPLAQTRALVFDVKAGSATFGKQLGTVGLGNDETFGVWFDPADNDHAYVSMWADKKVLELDLTDPTQPKVTRSFDTGKDPEGIAFLDSRWMAVGNDLGDSLTLIDRVAGSASIVPVDDNEKLEGLEPSALAYDSAAKRLYVALSGMNAIAAYNVDLSKTPPAITPAGMLATDWWPSGVAVMPDGSLAVANMRSRGAGPGNVPYPPGHGAISDLIRGGVQHIPSPTSADLTAGESAVTKNNDVAGLAGTPTVTCPSGASDFPVPVKISDGPSPVIKHVFFILRENKDFDAIFGDMKGVEGDPKLTLKAKSSDMESIWHNIRALARAFTVSDNYYTSAVQSTQGHVWATYGRSNDFNERTWALSNGPRAVPGGGIVDVGRPEEGSLFDWLGNEGVDYDIMGEIVGRPEKLPARNPVDFKYPGGPFQNIGYNDVEKACHIAGRVRVLCDVGQFSYMTITNDHTFGLSPNSVTPETNCAVNDEATGMIVDAVSHSPLWKESLIIVTEDDPLDGSDHIDSHRTPLVMISPWIKRGYVSHQHLDIASLHKLFAHIFGKPYPNYPIENAALPLDMFTSTPDYTPYTYTPRQWPLTCGGKSTRAERRLTSSWDFSRPDSQPGLSAQVMRWMRGKQLTKLPRELELQVEARLAAKRAGVRLPPLDPDDE